MSMSACGPQALPEPKSMVRFVCASVLFALLAPCEVAAFDLRKHVEGIAQELARLPYVEPPKRDDAARIAYNEYFSVRVKPSRRIWADKNLGFELHPMPLGSLFDSPVTLTVVDGEILQPITDTRDLYDYELSPDKVPADGDLGISGFRITSPLNHPSKMDELVVFQGASYFRALSKGQVYGLSARGLSINAGRDNEEFPAFRRFWIEKPTDRSRVLVHALLDSPSVTGAYRFAIEPGASTTVNVIATLFMRRDTAGIGLAPLTSMFFYGLSDQVRKDFRPQIHDSDGLAVFNGQAERLWRPLRNPATAQFSAFRDIDPKGFGLFQRQRSFKFYQDLEANYHRRPSAWVEPVGSWGAGSVELIELPTDSEVHDNVVAQWRPDRVMRQNQAFTFSYRLSWPSAYQATALVSKTLSGPVRTDSVDSLVRFVIDYAPTPQISARMAVVPNTDISASTGRVHSEVVQRNVETGGLRITFVFEPEGDKPADLRLALVGEQRLDAEVWIYRWTRDGPPSVSPRPDDWAATTDEKVDADPR
jgi:periplasmic glucans biosynthesis protein